MKKTSADRAEKGRLSKEVYGLWWEYLKRSAAYQKFCTLMSKLRKNDNEDYFEVYERVEQMFMSCAKTRKQKDEKYHGCYSLLRSWEKYGDVFNNSFHDWWEQNKNARRKKPVIDISEPNSECVPMHMIVSSKTPLKKKSDIITVDFMRNYLSQDVEYFYVAVPIFGNVTINEIADQISRMRKKHQEKEKASTWNEYRKGHSEPVGRVRIDELKRYLKVYDLKVEGKKIKEIVTLMGKDEKDVDETRRIYSDLSKANKIILNVQNGIFPGEYH